VLVGIWLASGCATIVGILAAVGLSRLPRFRAGAPIPPLAGGEGAPEEPAAEPTPLSPPRLAAVLAAAYGLAFAGALALHIVRSLADERLPGVARTVLSDWTLPALIGGVVLFGWARGANVFTSFVEGGKEGFQVAVRILPYLVVILVAVGMFRATGGLDWVVSLLDPITGRIGMPAEALPVALMRPLSASGAYGLAADAIRVHGPDSYVGLLVSTLHGSSETTFYVLAVYFGAVGVKRTRHALPACLLADVAGVASAVLVVRTRLG
jgi:spore maturation protein SpmB